MESLRPPKQLLLSDNPENDWKLWVQQFKFYATATGLSKKDNNIQAATFMSCIGPAAIPIFQTFKLNQDKMTLEELMTMFEGYFTPKSNVTYERSLNLFNIKPILINSKQTYSYNLFTLTNDAFEFNDQLEDFTQAASPQISTNFNSIDENWIVCKDNVLETGCSGIVIIKQSLTDFQLPIAYQTFLLFKFNHETKIYAQQIYIGTILIDPKILFESNSTVQMERNELYKDFLTIVSTSRQESFTVKLERDRLIIFLTHKLKFITISESGVFYKNDSYWSNTLVRYDYSVAAESQNVCNMKIYSSGKHQIDTFIRCLVYEHGDRCDIIKPAQNIVKNFTLYKNLLMEIGMKIEYLKNVQRLDKLLELYTSEMITEIKCVLE